MGYKIVARCGAVAAVAALAACSGGGTAGTPASTRGSTASGAPAQPATAAAARSAALRYFSVYSAGQYGASWALLNPAVQRVIPREVWVAVHEGCQGAGTGRAYDIKRVAVDQDTAVVTVSVAGAQAKAVSGNEAFAYASGRWGYMPADMGLYEHGSVAKDIAAAKARGLCSG
jgi:hypothetical protein